MAASDILNKIESTYEVDKITSPNGRKVWPLLRQKIVFDEVKKTIGLSNKLRTRNSHQLFKNFFYGFNNLFCLKKFDYVFFNNTDKRIQYRTKKFDIFFDAWSDKVGQKKSLFIEWASNNHLPSNETYSKNIISDLPFKFLTTVVSKFVKSKLVNEKILDKISTAYDIPISIKKELNSKLAELLVFKFIFKIIKPKAIFVLSSFTKVSIVLAAKELGIKVYEAQHGYIGDLHTFYSTKKKCKEAYPDYLLSFGTYEKQKATPELIFDSEQIIPVGSFQLELIKSKPIPEDLLKLKEKYTLVFCVTLQAIKEKEILQWIMKEAQLHSDWLFVIRAKNRDEDYSTYTTQSNIIELKNFNIYEVLKISDYNITIYSTTAIEGAFLGAHPIFFNINNLSKNHFDVEEMNAIVIDEGELLNNTILNKQIHKEQSFFVDNYLKNIAEVNLSF